jgi:hypothetical protein
MGCQDRRAEALRHPAKELHHPAKELHHPVESLMKVGCGVLAITGWLWSRELVTSSFLCASLESTK